MSYNNELKVTDNIKKENFIALLFHIFGRIISYLL